RPAVRCGGRSCFTQPGGTGRSPCGSAWTAPRRGASGRPPWGCSEVVQESVRLTSFSHGAGCACKLGPAQLGAVMELLGPSAPDERLLVSETTGDDAAVYLLDEHRALVLTIDFFTPLVDDA